MIAPNEFTPGPWAVERDATGTVTGIIKPVDILDGGVLRIADAHLIAAAPDLLASLKEAHAALVCYPNGDIRDEADIIAAEAAIAKAEGKQ